MTFKLDFYTIGTNIKCRNQWKIEKLSLLSLFGNLFCIFPFDFGLFENTRASLGSFLTIKIKVIRWTDHLSKNWSIQYTLKKDPNPFVLRLCQYETSKTNWIGKQLILQNVATCSEVVKYCTLYHKWSQNSTSVYLTKIISDYGLRNFSSCFAQKSTHCDLRMTCLRPPRSLRALCGRNSQRML